MSTKYLHSSPLEEAAWDGNLFSVVRILNNPNTTKTSNNYNNAIRYAALNDHIAIVSVLLKLKELNPIGALRGACSQGCIDIVRLLLDDHRVDPAEDNNAPIRYASMWGHTNIVNLLLTHPSASSRVDPSVNQNTPVRWAAGNGCTNVVARLLKDSRVDPCANKNEALHSAIREGYSEVIDLITKDPRYQLGLMLQTMLL